MSATTSIEWTDRTWNPLTGCTKVSPGCDNCYAKTMHERFNGPGSFDTVTLHPERLDQPLRWRKPRKVFVNSMSDLFHKDVPDEFIVRVFATMRRAHEHTFQLLTKRHARMRSLLSSPDFEAAVIAQVRQDIAPFKMNHFWPLPNVWLGVSVENQQWADIRIPALLDTPASLRFLSCEPLLGPINLHASLALIEWVIVGGESGRGARPMDPSWARSLRDQCESWPTAFLFKQWGAWAPRAVNAPDSLADALGDEMERVGKKAAGRDLDGRTWDEYPVRAA